MKRPTPTQIRQKQKEMKRLANTLVYFNGTLMFYKQASPMLSEAYKNGVAIECDWTYSPPIIKTL